MNNDEINAILGGRQFSLQLDDKGNPIIYEVTIGTTSRHTNLVNEALGKWLRKWVKDSALCRALSRVYSEGMHTAMGRYTLHTPVKISISARDGYTKQVDLGDLLELFDEYDELVNEEDG